MELKEVCQEILDQARKNKVHNLAEFNKLKMKVLGRLNYHSIPKNATIASLASKKDRQAFKDILTMKPVRTLSGVSPLALMTDPYPCPHSIKGIGPCTYCPGGPNSAFGDVPQSYTGKEPSTRRAMRNLYDPYLGVMNRLEHYVVMGLAADKCDVILQGGTFPFSPWAYQEYFVKYLLKAMNDFSRLFYENGELNSEKFNLFFELPGIVDSNDRTNRIHRKILFIKNLDLKDARTIDTINQLFFSTKESKKIAEPNNPRKKIRENGHPIDTRILEEWHSFSIDRNKQYEASYKTQNDKTESFADGNKRIMKLVREKPALFGKPSITLQEMQEDNETAIIRCIGLTIETKSDYGKLTHANQMLKLGCTRVELGIQSIYDEVLEKTNRGNSGADNIESIRILKDLGFKINAHYMPGLPLTTKEMDRKGLRALFENPDYKPDMLKVYPCMVMKGTKLYDDWKKGLFKPLMTKEAAELIAEMFSYVPQWCRVMRVQRDIPTYATESGVDRTNLRQYVEKVMKDKGIVSNDIRAREAGMNAQKNILIKNATIRITPYEASQGEEFFIQMEDANQDVLFGFIRMRFPSQFLREEITKDAALIRELHVYSSSVPIGKKSKDSFQHQGIGKKLLQKAEEIAKENGKSKMVIISGIGVREYFKRLGYSREGPYMVKKLQKKF